MNSPTLNPGLRERAWSSYWATGALQSCPDPAAADYGPVTSRFWLAFLAGLGSDSRLLELGCGNGALVKLAMERGPQAGDWRIDAIDLARLQPWMDFGPAAQARVRFHGETSMESLPFENQSFSHVASHYAIEYAEQERAWSEVFRVCRPGASIALILHYRDSLPFDIAGMELGHVQWVLESNGLFDTVLELAPYAAMAATSLGLERLKSDTTAMELRQRYNRLQQELGDRAKASAYPQVLDAAAAAAGEVLQRAKTRGRDEAEALLGTVKEGFEDASFRYAELQQHALDDTALERLTARLAAHGFALRHSEALREHAAVVGWAVHAVRPAAASG